MRRGGGPEETKKLDRYSITGSVSFMTGLSRLDAPGVLHHIMLLEIERRKIFRNNLLFMCQRAWGDYDKHDRTNRAYTTGHLLFC